MSVTCGDLHWFRPHVRLKKSPPRALDRRTTDRPASPAVDGADHAYRKLKFCQSRHCTGAAAGFAINPCGTLVRLIPFRDRWWRQESQTSELAVLTVHADVATG